MSTSAQQAHPEQPVTFMRVWSSDPAEVTVASLLNIGRSAAYGMVESGRLPCVRVGAGTRKPHIRVPLDAVMGLVTTDPNPARLTIDQAGGEAAGASDDSDPGLHVTDGVTP